MEMTDSTSYSLRLIFVFMSAVIYWVGVIINVRRIRRHTGKSPNMIRVREAKENILLLGWFFIIAGWMGQPLLLGKLETLSLFSFIPMLHKDEGIVFGILLALSGYAGTLWCYSAMGSSWRLGINKKAKTSLIKNGPYKPVRHPIYSFQIVILLGMLLLLPTPFSFLIIAVHFVCISIMALDEEKYLMDTHGSEYNDYYSRTGRFLPRLCRHSIDQN